MSQSPLVPGESKELDSYLQSWKVLNRLVAKGRAFSGHERNCCFLNTGEKPFADVSATSGIDWADDTRGVALVDWDRDGDLDFWASNRTAPRVRLMRNNSPSGNQFVALRLRGTQPRCNRDAIGARVELWINPAGGADKDVPPRKRIKTLYAGNGFVSQSSKWIHFGVPSEERIDRVVVRWPDGSREAIRGVLPGHFYHVVQGEGAAKPLVDPRRDQPAPQLADGPLPRLDVSDAMRIVLTRRQLLPTIEYTNLAGESVNLDENQEPLLINLWADWCQPCVKELREFAQQTDRLKAAGLRVVALHVGDANGSREGVVDAATPLLERLQYGESAGIADIDTIKMLDTICDTAVGLHRELPLPSSFLIDRSRRVCVIYKGPVRVDQLLKDVESIGGVAEQLIEPAAAYAGIWHTPPTSYDSLGVARRLLKAGQVDDATDYLLRSIDHAKQLAAEQEGPDPALAAIYHVLGTIYRTTGRRPQAVDIYRQAVQEDPNHWAAHFDLGTMFLKEGRYDVAGEHLIEALRIKPDDADVLNKLSVVQMGLKRMEEAAPYLEQALALEPDNVAALRNLATVHLGLKNARQAVPYLTRLLSLQPGDAQLRLELGHALHQIGEHRDALLQYRRALDVRPDWIPAMNATAWLLATQDSPLPEEIEEAVELAEKVCQSIGRPQPSALDTLAAALASAGRFDEAVETAQQAMEIAERGNAEEFVAKLRRRLSLYRQRRPYRESDEQTTPDEAQDEEQAR